MKSNMVTTSQPRPTVSGSNWPQTKVALGTRSRATSMALALRSRPVTCIPSDVATSEAHPARSPRRATESVPRGPGAQALAERSEPSWLAPRRRAPNATARSTPGRRSPPGGHRPAEVRGTPTGIRGIESIGVAVDRSYLRLRPRRGRRQDSPGSWAVAPPRLAAGPACPVSRTCGDSLPRHPGGLRAWGDRRMSQSGSATIGGARPGPKRPSERWRPSLR